MTSCITFNCNSVYAPPFPIKPNLLAGTWHAYSGRANNHDANITMYNGVLSVKTFICCNFK